MDLKSIAFCCISTGEYRFPAKEAASIAVRTVRDFLMHCPSIEHVVFDVYKDSDCAIYESALEVS
jgi:O-acetyl-ADP-ribose deacetylase (regulator of RNase III)